MPPAAPAPVTEASSALAKKPRGTTGQKLFFQTNVYPLSVQKKIPYFKHDIRIRVVAKTADGKEHTRELTNSSRFIDDDTRKAANVNVLHALAKKEPFTKKSLIYDRAAILFTAEEIIKKGAEEELTFTLPRAALGSVDGFDNVTEVNVAVKKATDQYQITSDDYLAAAGADFMPGVDKSIFELLNIATSQCVVEHQKECAADSKSRIYILNPGEYALQEEKEIGDGQILRTSLKKSVKTIENTLKDGKVVAPIAAIVIDVSRTAMHKAELLSTKMKNRSHPSTMIGLKVKKTYGNKELLTVTTFTNENVAQVIVEIGDKKMKLVEFIKKQYGITLKDTNIPAMKDRKGNTYPPELLQILPQMVKPDQNTANTSRAVITANATPGEERMATITSLTKALHLDGDSAKKMGVMLEKNTTALRVEGRMLPSKKLVYGKAQTTMGFQRGDRPAFLAANVANWAFFAVSGRDHYRWVIEILQKKGREHGMTVAPPKIVDQTNLQGISAALGNAAAAGCTYAFIVSDFDGDHELIKMAEREHGIMTQQIRGRTTEKVQADSGSNIALKMNIKNGGVNHVVGDEPLLLREDTLIMALVFDHPSSLSKKEMEEGARPTMPAVVGISSNASVLKRDGKNLPESCQNFIEKFAYANPREWKKDGEPKFNDTVFELMRHEVEAFKVARGKPALKIIVYVSGVPEAERGYWSKEGKSLVTEVCHTFSKAYNPAMTIITMSTEGCERFVAEGKPANLRGPDPRIGLVIDSVVVNPKVNEFFLQSAKALKGTPRTIKYTLVAEPTADAAKYTMDQLECLTWALAHLHQHCNGTIGFPSPSRIAADAAKRAKSLFNIRRSRARGPYDLEELNVSLGFKNTKGSSTTRSV